MRNLTCLAWAVVGAVSISLQPPSVQAQPTCASLPGEKIYMRIGDTQQPVVKLIGRKLRDAARPVTLVYVTSPSCTNINSMFTGANLAVNALYLPSVAENPTYDPVTQPELTCTITAPGVPLDIGVSATFVSSCNPGMTPANIRIDRGPVQAYLFVTPKLSSEVALTAEEGYFVFGFGQTGGVMPWVDENLLFIRRPTTSTALTTSAGIGVDVARLKGKQQNSSSEVLTAVQSSAQPQATLGLMGTQIYDGHRDTLNALAFRAFKQKYAYYPDSTPAARDKRNVRDGHYTVWSPIEVMTYTQADGSPSNPTARYVADLLIAKDRAAADYDSLDAFVSNGMVPYCAMQVDRPAEGANFSLYAPPEPCGCAFESRLGVTKPATNVCDATKRPCRTGVCDQGQCRCIACSASQPCPGGACRRGFCEVR